MLKQICRRFLSMTLAMFMLLPMLPKFSLTVKAASTLELSVNGLTAQYDGSGWNASGNEINGSVTGSGGCSERAGKGALTLINDKTEEALLSFDYSVILNDGSVVIDGNAVKNNGHFEKTIESGDVVSISIVTKVGAYTTSIKISNLNLIVEKDVTTTFVPGENGAFKIDGEIITEETIKSQLSTVAYNVEAISDEGYKFLGWYSETTQEYLGTDSKSLLYVENDQVVTAKFVPETAPFFETAGINFVDLNEAVSFAQKRNANKITLIDDGILPAGEYVIPKGITLLIPFDASKTTYAATPANTSSSYTKPTAFRTLTMAEGANITVNGAISISAKHGAAPGGGNYGGSPSGNVGLVKMESGSNIIVNNGGALYAWGFVSGNGHVEINSGATVYENFQIADFRGGTATSSLASGPIFPFSQYYVQNVEVPMSIHSGATEMVYSSLYAMGGAYSTSIEFIGNNGMFKLSDGATLTKAYDGTTDRLIFDLDGNAELKNLTVNVAVATVNSSNFNLPINSNITLNINSGTTTVNQTVALQPGVQANIANGAMLKISDGKKIYVYDGEQWGNYTMEAKLICVPFAPSKTYNRSVTDLKDVTVDVNGTLEVDGTFYTTEGGADITSSEGTGKIVFNKAAGTETTTQQYENNNTKVSVPVVAAKLHNADESYTETADAKKDDTYTYINGKWSKGLETVQITFNSNDEAAATKLQTISSGEETKLESNAFVREGYEFTGWNTDVNGSGTSYEDEATVTLSEDTILYAQWKKQIIAHSITFDANEGVGEMSSISVNEGEEIMLTANSFTREGYDFTGWNTEANGSGTPYNDGTTVSLTKDVTLYAQWKLKTFTVTWVDESGNELEKDENVSYGSNPEFNGQVPVKENTAQYSYSFTGWTPEVAPVTSDVTYKTVYSETENSYTITWKNGDQELLSETYKYGEKPSFNDVPVKEADAQYSYKFTGWNPTVENVTGNATYDAQFEATVNSYTVTWMNGDNVLDVNTVEYGTVPVYGGEEPPHKDSTAQYTYTFKGWDVEPSQVTGDVTYKATFTETINSYTVNWLNGDDVIKSEEVAYGVTPAYSGDTPSRESTEQFKYEFEGWSPEIEPVSGNVEYRAQFTESLRTYAVTWVSEDGTVLETDDAVPYGTLPEFNGKTPTKAEDDRATYSFKGWTPEVTNVAGDVTYTAIFNENIKKYTITWKNEDGTVLKEDSVEYGAMPSYEGEEPAKKADAQYTYTFKGWDPVISAVSGNTTYTATYEKNIEKYTVYWQNWNNDLLEKDEEVEYGTLPEYNGQTPTKTDKQWFTYEFIGWTPDVTTVEGEVTYTATFKETGLNGWQLDEKGKTYVEDGIQKYFDAWTEIDGNTYFFDPQGYVVTGLNTLTSQDGSHVATFIFDENGVFQKNQNGLYTVNDDIYWTTNGEIAEYAGLQKVVKEDGEINYYYFGTDNKAVKATEDETDYKVEKNNDLLPVYKYKFDESGVIVHFEDTSINGIYLDEQSSSYYYCIDGVIIPRGLFEHEGHYYYARSSTGALIRNCSYWITVTNNLLDEGIYTFNSLGQIEFPEPEPDKNGIVSEDESLYYYVDGVRTGAGLIYLDGNYYYVKSSNGEVVHGRTYWISATNDLLPSGQYEFDDEDKMINVPGTTEPETPEVKNGIIAEDGSLYYYVDGKRTGVGLIYQDGNYYYAKTSSGEIVHGRTYWVSATNNLQPSGQYEFDEEGKMIIAPSEPEEPEPKPEVKNGIISEDDKLFYYENGKRAGVGLVVIWDETENLGYYYYARTSNGEIIRNRSYWITATNSLGLEPALYSFDAQGRIVGQVVYPTE